MWPRRMTFGYTMRSRTTLRHENANPSSSRPVPGCRGGAAGGPITYPDDKSTAEIHTSVIKRAWAKIIGESSETLLATTLRTSNIAVCWPRREATATEKGTYLPSPVPWLQPQLPQDNKWLLYATATVRLLGFLCPLRPKVNARVRTASGPRGKETAWLKGMAQHEYAVGTRLSEGQHQHE